MKSTLFIILSSALLLAGSGATFARKPEPHESAATEWYVKTTVAVVDPANGQVFQDTRSGVFGQLTDSAVTQDRHDIPAWASTAGSPAALVFVQGADWGDKAGEYLSDYHPAGKKKDSWTFTVHSNRISPKVTLNWDGLFALEPTSVGTYTETRDPTHKLFKRLHLIDLASGVVIKPSNPTYQSEHGNTYTFDMSGQASRQFRWVLGKVRPQHLVPNTAPTVAEADRMTSRLQGRQDQAAQQTLSAGGFGTPPEGAPQTGGTP